MGAASRWAIASGRGVGAGLPGSPRVGSGVGSGVGLLVGGGIVGSGIVGVGSVGKGRGSGMVGSGSVASVWERASGRVWAEGLGPGSALGSA